MKRNLYRSRMIALIIGFVIMFFGSFLLGRYAVSADRTFLILADRLLRGISKGRLRLTQIWDAAEAAAVENVRLPRIAAAALIGAGLSAAGCAFQAMFRNPMVSPDLLGASTGAGFGAALGILLGLRYAEITVLSFIFGLAAVTLAYFVGRKSRIRSNLAMVLAGVMIGSLFSSATSFLKLIADTQEQLPAITYWLMGSLSSVRLRDLHFAMLPIALGLLPLLSFRWRINLLSVSEAEARSMGVDTGKLRLLVIACATLVTAGSVSISGMIGWVGLVIPHIGRLLFGQDQKRLMPASMLLGASFLMLVDDVARTAGAREIPIGILTSLIGAPLFLYLILSGGTEREA